MSCRTTGITDECNIFGIFVKILNIRLLQSTGIIVFDTLFTIYHRPIGNIQQRFHRQISPSYHQLRVRMIIDILYLFNTKVRKDRNHNSSIRQNGNVTDCPVTAILITKGDLVAWFQTCPTHHRPAQFLAIHLFRGAQRVTPTLSETFMARPSNGCRPSKGSEKIF